jgi:SAM-dependent methyltransferase
MVEYANANAAKLGFDCEFVATDILKIDSSYHNRFDYIFITIGALTWFEDLVPFFRKVADCLKPGGSVILHEMHPVANMFAAAGESNYDGTAPNKAVNSYFKSDPWVENHGIAYISG